MAKISAGQPAPLFTLLDLDGRPVSLEIFFGRLVLLNFWSAECPLVTRADSLIASWAFPVVQLIIASNTGESPDLIRRVSMERGLGPVLLDTGQQVADLYGVQITPHYFLVDSFGLLRYQGGLDNSTFCRRTPTRYYLKEAINALLSEQPISEAETPPFGCAIVRSTA